MYLSDPARVPAIILEADFSIFFFDHVTDFPQIPRAIVVRPNDRDSITIEEIRTLTQLSVTKPTADQIFVIEQADRLTEAAANACLKLLEETAERTHIAFLIAGTTEPLPTIKSRAQIYSLVKPTDLGALRDHDPQLLADAKLLLGSRPADLVALATRYKSNRPAAIELVATAVELAYKSFFKTGNPKFLTTLQRLLQLDQALRQNGHLRLQIIANMV
jgi:hypothetical protein